MEEGKPLLVGNLDFIFEQVGGEQPYDVWIDTNAGTDYPALMEEFPASMRSQSLTTM